MNSNMYIPFTYHIAWTEHNLHYYGVRVARGTTPADLWTRYFTSSYKVKGLRESLGEPDVIEVRKTFETREQAVDWEARVLTHLSVTKSDNWINESCWPAVDNRGKKHSEETKRKMSAAAKGNLNWRGNIGKKHSEERKKKMSETRKGRKLTQNWKDNIGKAQLGKKHTQESKYKMSEIRKKYWENKKSR